MRSVVVMLMAVLGICSMLRNGKQHVPLVWNNFIPKTGSIQSAQLIHRNITWINTTNGPVAMEHTTQLGRSFEQIRSLCARKILFIGCSTTRELFLFLAQACGFSVAPFIGCNSSLDLGTGCFDCRLGTKSSYYWQQKQGDWTDLTALGAKKESSGLLFSWKPDAFTFDDWTAYVRHPMWQQADLVFFHKGVHDFYTWQSSGWPVSDFFDFYRSRLQTLMTLLKSEGRFQHLLFRTMYTPHTGRLALNWTDVGMNMNKIAKELAARAGIPVLDAELVTADRGSPPSKDGVHQHHSVIALVLQLAARYHLQSKQ